MPPPSKPTSSSLPPKSLKSYEYPITPTIFQEPDDTTSVDSDAIRGETRVAQCIDLQFKILKHLFFTNDHPIRRTTSTHSHL